MPVSSPPDCIGRVRRVIAATGLMAPVIGHAGDGNPHTVLLFELADASETATARRINETLVDLALSIGGTVTGEHGTGLGKKAHMTARTVRRLISCARSRVPSIRRTS